MTSRGRPLLETIKDEEISGLCGHGFCLRKEVSDTSRNVGRRVFTGGSPGLDGPAAMVTCAPQ
jgi:hypothetical protein